MSEVAVLDELRVGGLTLTGVTRGGIETCLMVQELGLMFDVGMCPPGAIRYPTILVSHGHADHLGGLPYLVSQHGLMSAPPPVVHMPEEIVAPIGQILALWSQIEGFELKAELHGHAPGDRVRVGRDLVAVALRTSHRVPSLAWVIERTTHRLRPEYAGRDPRELGALRFLVDTGVGRLNRTSLPLGTIVVNATACLALPIRMSDWAIFAVIL